MASQWDHALSRMHATSMKMRKGPTACKDDELLDLLTELEGKWAENDEIIQSGRATYNWSYGFPAGSKNYEQILVDRCCYYEGLIEGVLYEISRRPWLKC